MKDNLTRIIRWPALRSMFGGDLSRSTIDRWEKSDLFPKRVNLGKNSVGWNLISVERWFSERSAKGAN